MADRVLLIREHVIDGKRLGRHINHDPRSLQYLVPQTSTPSTQIWDRRIPILDQGNLGSCTGNATVGALGTGPLFEALSPSLQGTLNETLAVDIYSAATKIDSAPGQYKPDDTGSDGLSVAKVAQKSHFSSGYTHITSLEAAYAAIKAGPFITGVSWYSGMDNPTSGSGEAIVHAKGSVRGGHEFLVRGYDATRGLWLCDNSWSDSWGDNGSFRIPDADYVKLLADQGDATVLLPITAPAPVPTPIPVPAPTPAPSPLPETLLADLLIWANHPHGYHSSSALAKEVLDWQAGA